MTKLTKDQSRTRELLLSARDVQPPHDAEECAAAPPAAARGRADVCEGCSSRPRASSTC